MKGGETLKRYDEEYYAKMKPINEERSAKMKLIDEECEE